MIFCLLCYGQQLFEAGTVCIKLVVVQRIITIMILYVPVSQQVFMWEANLFLAGGVHAQDQYRDLRLDIDHMSYEVCIFLLFYLKHFLHIDKQQ